MSGTNSAIGGGGFHHVAMHVADLDASLRFYVDGLGFTPRIGWGQGNERAVMLDTGDGNYLELFAGGRRVDGSREAKAAGVFLHVALRTRDCDAAVERARRAGARVTVEPKDVDLQTSPVTRIRIAFFTGPDGETLELFQSLTT